ncbi:MAG: acyl carrier protein [Ruminococcaceae bacterium]|nr:acyl carrier protein [Oscillospiraceae bacterium]
MVFEKVAKLLAEQLDADYESITPDTNILDDLNADSLDVVEMLMGVEEEFDVQIPDDEIENLKTVGAVVDYIQAHQGE